MSYNAPIIRAYSHLGNFPHIERVVKSSTESWLAKHSKSGTLILYHYTTGEGLKGIIENRSIWCTYINVLNDPLEIQYGKELIKDRFTSYIGKESNEIIKNALIEIGNFPSSLDRTHYIFVTSFCENDNLLSQWRGYADKGVGYNLGINFDSETKFCRDPDNFELNLHVNLRKVIYDKSEQIKIIDQYISDLIGGLKSTFIEKGNDLKGDPGLSIAPISIMTSNLLIDMMVSMKNPVFKEESEWRLLRVILTNENHDKYKFRLINNELIPYIDTYIFKQYNNIPQFPLQSIKYGPMLGKDKNDIAMQMFFKTCISSPHTIKLSDNIKISDSGYTLRG